MSQQGEAKAKHTPGLWKLWHDDSGAFEVSAGDFVICTRQPLPRALRSEGLANAYLIWAAPKMLEALKNIENDDGRIPPTIWRMVKYAIAEAEASNG